MLCICCILVIIVRMLFLGAQYNFKEFEHKSLLLDQQLFLLELKQTLKKHKPLNYENLAYMEKTFRSMNISNNSYSNEYVMSLLSNEFKNTNILDMIDGSIKVCKRIRRKIAFDHLIRPLRIFWVKADYTLLVNIFALLGSFASIIILTFVKSIFGPMFENIPV